MSENSGGSGLVGPEKRLVVYPERRRRVNLPLPTRTSGGLELPPINIEPIAPMFLVRSLPEEDANMIFDLAGRKLYTGKQSAQDIGQIVKLPQRVEIHSVGESKWKIPGWPEDRQDAKVGDIFVCAGVAHVVRTNWGPDNQVLLARDPSQIIACWVYEGDYEYEYMPLDEYVAGDSAQGDAQCASVVDFEASKDS